MSDVLYVLGCIYVRGDRVERAALGGMADRLNALGMIQSPVSAKKAA